MAITTGYPHIVLNQAGIPVIAGTTMKVVELVLDHKAYGWSPEELHLQHPHLSLGQIHSALAYYWITKKNWTGTSSAGCDRWMICRRRSSPRPCAND